MIGPTLHSETGLPGNPTRTVVERVWPEIQGGRYPVKRCEGDRFSVTAIVVCDGHDELGAAVRYRHQSVSQWTEVPLASFANDRWEGEFFLERSGLYYYGVVSWVDAFASWREATLKKLKAGQDLTVEVQIGLSLIVAAARRAPKEEGSWLLGQHDEWTTLLEFSGSQALVETARQLTRPELAEVMKRYPDRRRGSHYPRELRVEVQRKRARFSSWYEFFPRSAGFQAGVHGTFQDCEKRIPMVADMGFQIVYFPPIHPIGVTERKGPNNSLTAGPEDPGSPWAIGGEAGGHKSIHPKLGTMGDFRNLTRAIRSHDMEVALDIAFQCSPDHPYVKEHPDWFVRRPDGSIQYAENPPKKYQDIYPFDFECEDWRALWTELKSVFEFWMDESVRVFRVDNPHTKSFSFWEWVIAELRKRDPDVIFLSEAFTRPHVRYHLAKIGFSQSYTYFTWRTSKEDLTTYLTELTQTKVREYFRPNFWPNTPDILADPLRSGAPAAFKARLVLAATLSSNYGIYGPAFELCDNQPVSAKSEEYANSEKYQLRSWDWEASHGIRDLIRRVNTIRKDNPALQANEHLLFHSVDNDLLIAYSKCESRERNVILVVVNLDPQWVQSGWMEVDPADWGAPDTEEFAVVDLLTSHRYQWRKGKNYVELNPGGLPAHIFKVQL